MATYFDYLVQVWNGDSRGTASMAAAPTMNAALAGAFRDASYYLGSCGYERVTIEAREVCSTCNGDGTVRKARGGVKRCPGCKGKPIAQEIGPFPARFHENFVDDKLAVA